MNKKIIAVIAVIVIAVLAILIKSGELNKLSGAGGAGKTKITASFYPMAEFARQIGGNKVDVSTMVQPGVEPHDYDPTPGDLTHLYSSKVFIYNGAGLEKWTDRLQQDLNANHVAAVNASAGIDLRTVSPGSAEAGTDPHVWLDPVLASRQVTTIEGALAKADPANAAYYHDRAAKFKAQLADLDKNYRTGLSQCSRRDVITSHQAFGYLGARYGLNILPISGLSPDAEPSPQKLAEVARFAKDHHVTSIFFETLVSPKLSQTIAQEVGAKTLVFNPLEGLTTDQVSKGDNYLSVQQENLNNLRIALDCK